MRIFSLALALAAVWTSPLPAAYTNLIAAADGKTLYFTPNAGLYQANWASAASSPDLHASLARDINGAGAVVAAASFGLRYCGFAGSSCFTRPGCQAVFFVEGGGADVARQGRQTFIRLDRTGQLAWIEQDAAGCPGLGITLPPPLNGLYRLPSLAPVAEARGAILANRRPGRRVITNSGRALTFAGPQLQWVDASGATQIRHVYGAFEAVVDAAGQNIVYVDAPTGDLHWIASGNDELLNLYGSAPAISDDGRTLVYLSADGGLQIYDRVSRAGRRIGNARYLEFTIGGNAVFATTAANRLERIDLTSGAVTTLAEPFPDITSVNAPPLPVSISCPLVCYGTPPSWFIVGRGMLLVLQGRWLDQPGWQMRIDGRDVPVNPVSDTMAWVQIPSDLAAGGNTLEVVIRHPNHPASISLSVQVQDRVAACLGALHQDFSRPVDAANPLAAGDIVHLFLTGLHGVQTIPDGVPNPLDRLIPVVAPPEFSDPGAWQTLFFGLAPGLIGIQQLDMRVVRAPGQGNLFSDINEVNCSPIPVR